MSERTVKRDVDFMRCRFDLPVEYDPRCPGDPYTRAEVRFPSPPLAEAEVFALLVAHKAIAQYQGTPFQQVLERAFRKLTGRLDQQVRFSLGSLDEAFSFRPFGPDDADLRTFEVLSRAVQEREVVRFMYRKLGARSQRREVHPYHLGCIDSH